jgi:TonB-linked SusC/RagA family outer membrane protein
MKKKRNGNYSLWESKVKILRRMKLLTIFILFSMVTASANSYSQQTKFKFSLRNATVRSVFQEIEENSEFILLYDEKNVDVNRIVTINVNDESVNSILDQVFEGTGNTYKIFDRQIVILGTNDIEIPVFLNQPRQPSKISGKVMDSSGSPLPGVSVAIKGTTQGTITNTEGSYSLPNVPGNGTLMFSFVGMKPHEVRLEGKTTVNVVMEEQTVGIEEVIAVGYGTQKKMDITGSVASVQQERLEMVPNTNIAQAIQGAIPGVMMQTSSAGAVSEQTIMIRGRNSILADNSPLVVVDGIPYYGSWKDLNPNDVKSIEVLKDASAAAIYGSRGANGVILITTEAGKEGKPKISYDGYYSVQSFVKLPDLMNGEEFYNFKKEHSPGSITPSEQEIYDSGQWTDWLDLAMRNANSTEHNLSVSGGFQNTNYYISGGVLKVRGLALNDDYLRLTSRMNLDTQIAGWLTIGTRTQLSYDDRGGNSPTWEGDTGSVFSMNPLTRAYDENGKLMIRTWPEEPTFPNPLQATLAINTSETYQVISNNYAIVKFPFIPGLQYRINAGLRVRFDETNTYYGRDTKTGLDVGGRASSGRDRANNNVIENIVEYNHDFGKHNLFFTGVYSYESNKSNDLSTSAKGFPHDLLTWYSVAQAEVKEFDYSYNKTILLSQMLRLNYSYDSRYLLTLTGRRDGYSGFGAKTKWGVFPSMALGWNLAKENFFPWKNIVNDLKWRVSYGLNGNQAVGAYQTISRLGQSNYITGTSTLPGYVPSKLGMDDLGWESSKTFNLGFDFGLFPYTTLFRSWTIGEPGHRRFELLPDQHLRSVAEPDNFSDPRNYFHYPEHW